MLVAVGDVYLGPVPDILLRASCPFGGGVGGTEQELCGILSGATLLLGALFGRLGLEDDTTCYQLVNRYYEQFAANNGGETRCAAIRKRLPRRPKRCLPVIEQGVANLIEMIEQANSQPALACATGEPTCPT